MALVAGTAPSAQTAPRGRRPIWRLAAGIVAGLVVLPVLALGSEAIGGSLGLWSHLAGTILPAALADTLLLLLGVGLIAGFLGVTLAWLVTAHDFPGRGILEWALLLPLAVPTYIVAYAYLDILHPVGAFQGAVRWILGYSSPREFRLPDIRSLAGCVLLLSLVLYPYVYLTTRAMFLSQSANLLDAARTLGTPRRRLFRRVALPLARPAIAVGVSLTLMEALNDIGASEFLGVRTLTVSIYTTWVTKNDLAGATQIALLLLAIVVALVSFERWARRRQGYVSGSRGRTMQPERHDGLKGIGLCALGVLPVVFGFVVPAVYLAAEAWKRWRFAGLSDRLVGEAVDTLLYAGGATLLTLVLGVVAAFALRLSPGWAGSLIYRLATTGYAMPGTVVAIGVLLVVAPFDRLVDGAARDWFGVSTGLLLIGSGTALIYAYVVRFLAITAGSADAGLARVPKSLDDAARTLGRSAGGTLCAVHLPLTRASLAAGALLVFVDCIKELPATLLLRPLNMETFATHLYGEAARGTYEEASLAALAIVLIGILPVIVLSRVGRNPSS
ncbi:Iron ABC transporter, membrane spanning protein [uncultured Pleomorphomonas sp.]|uniref:Iron ABC transporter, membrane spanning protein n=1 Tax=uncultured Pleomorphomonas sp. TaxID=442121 RepID=A0A212KY97_9HYPH|nr:iron ABC transporter permease [uncultured Pleomorphomonas sp.]SCM70243.1 Iron ABC transporter, membrane spanning protein [uncultured Pleomorphomonas sp.]